MIPPASAPVASVPTTTGITVVVPTRNRGASIIGTITSIFAIGHACFEVIVVDQSTNDETAHALAPFLADPRVRYIHSNAKGANAARHIGLVEACYDIVAFTDDDCEVTPNWLASTQEIFARYPSVGIIFSEVIAGPHDPSAGYVPVTPPSAGGLISRLVDWGSLGGGVMGASMAVRRAVVWELGGLDGSFGPGTALKSADDTDLAVRALLHGVQIYRNAETQVIHHGFRTHEQGNVLMYGYMLGVAAVYAKLLRCGHWRAIALMAQDIWRTILTPIAANLLRLRRPPVLTRIKGFVEGFVQGCRLPIDHGREVFLTSQTLPAPSGPGPRELTNAR